MALFQGHGLIGTGSVLRDYNVAGGRGEMAGSFRMPKWIMVIEMVIDNLVYSFMLYYCTYVVFVSQGHMTLFQGH